MKITINHNIQKEKDIKEIKYLIIKIIKLLKNLYWNRIFNRKRYKQYIRFNSIIRYGKCHFRSPLAFLNYTYHYFVMDMLDKGWKRETVKIEPQYEVTYSNGTKEDLYNLY